MKKQFFYAAMALAVMSSCSKDNDPGIGNPEEEGNDRMPIELGLNTPTVSAISRGTGSVGDVDGANNKWNNQKLFIYMVNKADNLEAKEGAAGAETTILDNATLEFRAPRDGGDQTIRIYQTGSYDAGTDKGTIQYKYYPATGKYTFFGYHIDDATADAPTITAAEKKVTGITIDGTQDLLAAKARDMETDAVTDNTKPYHDVASTMSAAEWTALMDFSFGARTARKKVVPILKFDHQLARLKFFVRAGSDGAAGQKYEGAAWADNNAPDGTTLGMQVTGITLTKMVNKVDMDLLTTTSARNATSTDDAAFPVCTMKADGTLDKTGLTTTPIVPKYPYGHANIPADDPDEKGTQVGEPVMFFPNGDITLSIDLKQYVKDTENETTNEVIYKVLEKLNNPLTIDQTTISGAVKEFKPGASYNVYITIYGFERIEISAELTAWTEGGDIETDIEG